MIFTLAVTATATAALITFFNVLHNLDYGVEVAEMITVSVMSGDIYLWMLGGGLTHQKNRFFVAFDNLNVNLQQLSHGVKFQIVSVFSGRSYLLDPLIDSLAILQVFCVFSFVLKYIFGNFDTQSFMNTNITEA